GPMAVPAGLPAGGGDTADDGPVRGAPRAGRRRAGRCAGADPRRRRRGAARRARRAGGGPARRVLAGPSSLAVRAGRGWLDRASGRCRWVPAGGRVGVERGGQPAGPRRGTGLPRAADRIPGRVPRADRAPRRRHRPGTGRGRAVRSRRRRAVAGDRARRAAGTGEHRPRGRADRGRDGGRGVRGPQPGRRPLRRYRGRVAHRAPRRGAVRGRAGELHPRPGPPRAQPGRRPRAEPDRGQRPLCGPAVPGQLRGCRIDDRERRDPPSDTGAMTDQARSFGTAADRYDRYRPTYAEAAVVWTVGERPRRVADLGAGTGILSRVLHRPGHEVVAFGPVEQAGFGHSRWLTPDELLAMTTTRSPYLVASEQGRRELLDAVRRLTTGPELAGRERFEMPQLTRAYRARLRPA